MEHPIYRLDQAIVGCLKAVPEAALGAPFSRWQKTEEEAARLQEEETRRLARAAVDAPLDDMTPREKLVPGGLLYLPRNQAWAELEASTPPVWLSLLRLYSCVCSELQDMDNMALAIALAKQEGGAAHARQVQKIMALDEITEPTWWSGV